jgi:hypothetical protein
LLCLTKIGNGVARLLHRTFARVVGSQCQIEPAGKSLDEVSGRKAGALAAKVD